MIEVFYENNYNRISEVAHKLGVSMSGCTFGMIMREGDADIGLSMWTAGEETEICVISTIDEFGSYYDLLFRSTLNYLCDSVKKIVLPIQNNFFVKFGFENNNNKQMTAQASEIKFTSSCCVEGK